MTWYMHNIWIYWCNCICKLFRKVGVYFSAKEAGLNLTLYLLNTPNTLISGRFNKNILFSRHSHCCSFDIAYIHGLQNGIEVMTSFQRSHKKFWNFVLRLKTSLLVLLTRKLLPLKLKFTSFFRSKSYMQNQSKLFQEIKGKLSNIPDNLRMKKHFSGNIAFSIGVWK